MSEITSRIELGMALTWNPSLSGTKIEDTILLTNRGLEVLTKDLTWPQFSIEQDQRPDYLVMT